MESDGERISSGSDDESLTSACSDSVTTLATSTDGPPSVASITVDRRNTNRDSNGSISFNGGGGRGSRTRFVLFHFYVISAPNFLFRIW